jgi:hypothetical protein
MVGGTAVYSTVIEGGTSVGSGVGDGVGAGVGPGVGAGVGCAVVGLGVGGAMILTWASSLPVTGGPSSSVPEATTTLVFVSPGLPVISRVKVH